MSAWIAWICFAAAGAILARSAWKHFHYRVSDGREGRGSAGSPTAAVPIRQRLGELGGGWLRVASAHELVEACALAAALRLLRRESKLSGAVYERDIAPAIDAYLELVQLLPASEAHHHAHAGGLAAHTIETVLGAVRARNGHLLPPGGSAEQIDQARDHWTYGVLFGALLHDMGKIVTDLRVDMIERPGAEPRRWLPLSGTLAAAGAAAYRVGFAPKSERDYGAHRKLPLALLQRIVPATALAFLGRQPEVLQALTSYLGGEEGADSVIARIVRHADQVSAAKNLQDGSRVRFPSASAVPLIERMDAALRALLADGELPLNRDGAAGWVAGDEAIYFVAKRLADAVRERITLAQTDDGDGVPTRNDRLFDSWQDYRAIEPNPDTGQAIWPMVVVGQGYRHELAMLKFPLRALFNDPTRYPAPFDGTLERRPGRAGDAPAAAEAAGPAADAGSAMKSDADARTRAHPDRKTVPEPKPRDTARKAVPPRDRRTDTAAPRSGQAPDAALAMITADASAIAPECEANVAGEDFLDDEDSAMRSAESDARVEGRRPVVPHVPVLEDANGEPHPLAVRFMEWLQGGLASGVMRFNEPGAMVHFVEQGMALVSPRIFRAFAEEVGEPEEARGGRRTAPGTVVQRHVIRAGWHLVTAGSNNIQHYAVIKRGGGIAGKLAAVVMLYPQRWVNPVPQPNPNLKPFELVEHERSEP